MGCFEAIAAAALSGDACALRPHAVVRHPPQPSRSGGVPPAPARAEPGRWQLPRRRTTAAGGSRPPKRPSPPGPRARPARLRCNVAPGRRRKDLGPPPSREVRRRTRTYAPAGTAASSPASRTGSGTRDRSSGSARPRRTRPRRAPCARGSQGTSPGPCVRWTASRSSARRGPRGPRAGAASCRPKGWLGCLCRSYSRKPCSSRNAANAAERFRLPRGRARATGPSPDYDAGS